MPVVVARIAVEEERWAIALPDFEALVEAALAVLADRAGIRQPFETELGVTLSNDAAVRVLNAEWRGKDKATNVLSFPIADLVPGDTPGPMLGDLVLALETLEREAAEEGKSLADHFRHLVVHGALHCLGHDHATDEDAAAMEALEVAVLGDLGVGDPYLAADLEEEPARA